MLTRGKGSMPVEEFQRLIDQVKDHVFILYLYFQGEPFIHNDIYAMIRYATQNKIFVITSTNGHFFHDGKRARDLVESGLRYLIISMDGASEETYKTYRVGGDFQRVIQGIRNIVAIRRNMRQKYPRLAVQFLVMKQNEHEIGRLQKLAANLGVDDVLLKSVQVVHFDRIEEILPTNEKFRRYEQKDGAWRLKGRYYNFCTKLWVGSVISWDSHVFACCFDKDGQNLHESLSSQTFTDIWKGEKYQGFRQTVLRQRQSVEICRNCSEGQKIFHIL